MTESSSESPKGEIGGVLKTIRTTLSDGIATILIAKETLALVREQIFRLQGQLLEIIGSLNQHDAKIENLERQLAENEAEHRRLRERIEALERAQQYQAGRLDEAARRSE